MRATCCIEIEDECAQAVRLKLLARRAGNADLRSRITIRPWAKAGDHVSFRIGTDLTSRVAVATLQCSTQGGRLVEPLPIRFRLVFPLEAVFL